MASHFVPDWPLPEGVHAVITTREQGDSQAPFDSFNLALHVEDEREQVLKNRSELLARCQKLEAIQWLDQIHSTACIEAQSDGQTRSADASFSRRAGTACAVMTADCLPLLFCDQSATQVAATHAGWRGLAAGIVAETVASFEVAAEQLSVYLGPAIGPQEFEVGIEVLEAFFSAARSENHLEAVSAAFTPSIRPMRFYADLYALARAELLALGVTEIYGGEFCTVRDEDRFYSYRREKQTGRMASLIWLA